MKSFHSPMLHAHVTRPMRHAPVLHARWEPKRDDREGDEDHQPDEVGDDERQHAGEDGGEVDLRDHALDDEYHHPDRRMDEPELDRHHDDDAEPDRIEAELLDDGKDDWHREDDHGERIHQASQYEIHEHDERQHAVTSETQPGEEQRHLLRRLGDGEEIAEQQRADQHGEHG